MDVHAHWARLSPSLASDDWSATKRVYALLDPIRTGEALYVGIAYGGSSSVRARFLSHEERFAQTLRHKAWNIREAPAYAARLERADGGRISESLFLHVENLLIMSMLPALNATGRQRYEGRPVLRVLCVGAWPLRERAVFTSPEWVAPPPPGPPVRCANCGTTNNASFRFCGTCGAPLAS